MAGPWEAERLLAEVQERVRFGIDDCAGGRIPMQATLDDGDILVTFQWPGGGGPARYAVRALGGADRAEHRGRM